MISLISVKQWSAVKQNKTKQWKLGNCKGNCALVTNKTLLRGLEKMSETHRILMLIVECDLLFTDHHFSCMWEYEKYMLSTLMARVWTCPLTPKILKISFLVRCVKNIYLGFYYWKSFTTGSHYTVVCGFCGLKFFPNLIQQVCNHRLAVAHSLAQGLGWHVIHYSRHVGTGPKERQGHVGGLMVKSPNGSK